MAAPTRAEVKAQVLTLLRNHGERAFRPKEIAKRLNYHDQTRYRLFVDVLKELDHADLIAKAPGGRVQHRRKRPGNEAEGVLTVNPQGFGFVPVEGLPDDVYVPARRMGTAMHGDRVRLSLAAPVRGPQAPGVRREAEVIEVLERGLKETVGTFTRSGRVAFVDPDDQRLTRDVLVAREDWNGAEDGDKVVVSLDVFDDPKGAPEGRVLRVLGAADAPGVAVLAVALAQGVRAEFPPEVERDAERIPIEIPPSEIARRLDLRQTPIFTIDPVDAKDFDDAIHVTERPDGFFDVGVHIADVSHYVAEGTALDAEAYARGTSTYLVDRVVPMLPEALSNGVCSLRPREEKLAYSCLMEVSPRGVVRAFRFAETVIYSHARFSYEEAQDVLDGADHPYADDVRRAGHLAAALTKKRLREGAVDFDVPEVRVVLDEKGAPVDVIRKDRKPANRLIEELMLLANRSVAEEIGKRKTPPPFVYRVHGQPDPEKIAALAEYVRPFGYRLDHTAGVVEREALNAMLHQVQGTAEQPVIEQHAIRAMAKAVYSPDNIGHYGLGFRHYSHFTSPIRRYPDLIAHRLLKRYLAGGTATAAETLDEACRHLSGRERVATEAERESVRLKQVEYVARHVGEAFDGVVTGVTNFGAFVELSALLTEGLVHVRDMEGDYWEFDPRQFALIGRHTRRRIRPGDAVRVRIASANVAARRIDLVWDED